MIEKLLDRWDELDKRVGSWGTLDFDLANEKIAILEQLFQHGRTEVRDGRNVKELLDEMKEILRENMQMKRKA